MSLDLEGSKMHLKVDAVHFRALADHGWCQIPNAMDGVHLASIRSDAEGLRKLARKANVSSKQRTQENIRKSTLMPLYPPPPTNEGSIDTRMQLYDAVRNLQTHLQQSESLSLPKLDPFSTELSYLYYPAGGFYKRHLDVPEETDGWHLRHREGSISKFALRRVISFILYLEQNWQEEWGGELRVWKPGTGETVDILPSCGTLVLFFSDLIRHEVLETHCGRRCVVGWFRTHRWNTK